LRVKGWGTAEQNEKNTEAKRERTPANLFPMHEMLLTSRR
jgi:hypothetical protein